MPEFPSMKKRPFIYVRRYARFANANVARAASINIAADKNVKEGSVSIETNGELGEARITWEERSFIHRPL